MPSHGEFGSGERLSARGFLVLGLLTFWVYPALRFALALREHFERRWVELAAHADLKATDPRLHAFRVTGFRADMAAPGTAVALFVAAAVLVSLARWAAAAGVFYAGTFVLMVWALRLVRRHETLELLAREAGASALLDRVADPGDDLERRWQGQRIHVAAFLVVALAIAAAPAFGTHPVLIPLAAVYHAWGTALLARLYNGHLREEARHAVAAPAAGSPAAGDDAQPRRVRVAVMLTDMQDYSKAMEADESGAFARLQEHNRIMRAAIAAHRGREIKTIGDAFLVIFRSPVDAVGCALAAQRGFAEYNEGRGEAERIKVRIGIHVDEVLVTESDVFGDGVNIAARIEPLATPGGVCVSEPVLRSARRRLKLQAEPLEGVTLKNIASPPRLYRIII